MRVLKVEVAHVQALCSSFWPWMPVTILIDKPSQPRYLCQKLHWTAKECILSQRHRTVTVLRTGHTPWWLSAVSLCPLPCMPSLHSTPPGKLFFLCQGPAPLSEVLESTSYLPGLLLGVLGARSGVGGVTMPPSCSVCVCRWEPLRSSRPAPAGISVSVR